MGLASETSSLLSRNLLPFPRPEFSTECSGLESGVGTGGRQLPQTLGGLSGIIGVVEKSVGVWLLGG